MAQSLRKRLFDYQTDELTPPSVTATEATGAAAAADEKSPSLTKKSRESGDNTLPDKKPSISDVTSEEPLDSGDADLTKTKASPNSEIEEPTMDKIQSQGKKQKSNTEQKKVTAGTAIIDLTIDSSSSGDGSNNNMKTVKKTVTKTVKKVGFKAGTKQPVKTGTRKAHKGSLPTPAGVASDKTIATIVISDDSSTENTDIEKNKKSEKEYVKQVFGEEIKKPSKCESDSRAKGSVPLTR